MLVIPAIDLKDGQCVRLRQGNMDDSTVFGDNPVDFARHWVSQGARRLHLVDLNGAFAGEPVNAEAITDITKALPKLSIQIGGGIRSGNVIEYYLKSGISYVIIGTKAVQEPAFVSEMCQQFPGRIMVGLDAKAGLVATDGWAKVSTIKATELAKQFENDGVEAIIYTDIARDGMMKGVNIEATVAMAKASRLPVIASGGVTTIEDIKQLKLQTHHGISGAITGRALYEGTLHLKEAQALCDTEN